MADVKMYSKQWCPFCIRAKQTLKDLGIEFDDILVDDDPETLEKVRAETGQFTVPQIFVKDTFIGGCDELHSKIDSGEFEKLLNG